MHRDIKLENVVVTDNDEVRLIDFGLAKVMTGPKLEGSCGTPFYMAPEVIKGSYGLEADNWSLGVLLYFMVSGLQPFQHKTKYGVFRRITKCDFSFDDPAFETISPECKDLISQLLVFEPERRLTCQ